MPERAYLKQLRKQKGWTQSTLAEHLEVSPRTVSRWENTQQMPRMYEMTQLAEALDISVDDLHTVFTSASATSSALHVNNVTVKATHAIEPILRKVHAWVEEETPMELQRRQLLLGIATASAAAATSPLWGDPVHAQVAQSATLDTPTLTYLWQNTANLYQLVGASGPSALPHILAQRAQLQQLKTENTTAAHQEELTALDANLTHILGALYLGDTQFTASQRAYEDAYEIARQIHHTDLVVLVLSHLSMQARLQQKHYVALDYAQRADEWAGRSGSEHARLNALDILARAHAYVGDDTSARRTLDTAHSRAETLPELDRNPRHHYWVTTDLSLVEHTHGTCAVESGRYREAVDAVQRSISTWKCHDDAINQSGSYLQLARAYARHGDIEETVATIHTMRELQRGNTAAGIARDIHEARTELEPYQDAHAVRELDTQLRDDV